MRSTITTLLVFATAGLWAQTVEFKNLNAFDKIVIEGNVKSVHAKGGHCDQPHVTVSGLDEDKMQTKIEAGVFHLILEGQRSVEVVVANSNLKRIETDGEIDILGAEVMGSNGKYLITDFNHHHSSFTNHVSVDIPHIDIPHIDIPDIDLPDMDMDMDFNFDFDFDHDFNIDVDWEEDFGINWENHKDEMKHMGENVTEEVKSALKEVEHELERHDRDY